jgi:hypothetical protein
MSVKTAICYDECGTEVSIQVESYHQIPQEWRFCYWQEFSDRELAEWRLDQEQDWP